MRGRCWPVTREAAEEIEQTRGVQFFAVSILCHSVAQRADFLCSDGTVGLDNCLILLAEVPQGLD